MQVLKPRILWSFLLFFPFTLFSQNPLEGTWTVKCVIEKTDPATFRFDHLCRFIQVDEASVENVSYELRIDDKVIQLEEGDAFKSLPYTYDEENNKLNFKLNEEDLSYSILEIMESDDLILKSEEGTVVYLENTTSEK